MWQFAKAVEGIGEACTALGRADHRRQRQSVQRDRRQGHLSHANDRRRRAARSAPIAWLPAVSVNPGDTIILLGEGRGELGGSEYLKVIFDRVGGVPPAIDLQAERALQELIVSLASEALIRSAP